MGIIQRLKDARRRQKARDFAQELSNQFYLSPMCSDYENLFAQVRPLINEMKVVMPYGTGRNGGKMPLQRTPELELLLNPNDDMGWAEFADIMFATWLTEDELDIHVWKDARGNAIAYTILPPQCRYYLGYGRWQWQALTTTGMEVLGDEDVMRLRFSRSPRDIQRGVSPASAVRVWAQIDDLISQYQRAYFENGAIPATITFITASTKERYEATRKELEHNLKGARNRNKTVYAWRQFDNDTGSSVDQVEVKTIQGNNSTMAIKEIVEIINDRLNKAVGVSNFILGDDSSAKYSNAELSRQQFLKNRVYPALYSFWNQFQHELERVLGGGLGYAVNFDLVIPELTERQRELAEISKIRTDTLINLIEAGASAQAALDAMELPKNWSLAAQGIWIKTLEGGDEAPITIDKAPKLLTGGNATVDTCECGHCHSTDKVTTKDELPDLTDDEKKVYALLVELAESIFEQDASANVDEVIAKMVEMLDEDALSGATNGAESIEKQALELLKDEDIAKEIRSAIDNKEIYTSEALKGRLKARTEQIVQGYAEDVQNVLDSVLANSEGLTANEIESRLAEVLPRSRAAMIARTETTYAIKSGRMEYDKGVAERYGFHVDIVWRTSGDDKVCPICQAMDGKVIKLGDVFPDKVEIDEDGEIKTVDWPHTIWNDQGQLPCAHPNCVLGDTKVLADNVQAATRMNYTGEVVKLTTKGGRSITVTPNHILLTARGWVAAKFITESDKIVAHTDGVEPSVVNDTVAGGVPTIAEEFVAVSESKGVFTGKVPATTKDFKGDGIENEEIDIILADSLLGDKVKSAPGKFNSDLPFVGGKIRASGFNKFSSLDQLLVGVLATSDGFMGCMGEVLALAGSKSTQPDVHRLTSTAAYNARLEQAASNSASADTETFSKGFLAKTRLVELDDIASVEIQTVHDTPVYDLQTTSTLYSANGIISSNCRCYYDEVLEV